VIFTTSKLTQKKTKWMQFGDSKSIVEPIVRVNGEILEKVEQFKFLGVIISSNGKPDNHLSKRKSLFFNGVTEVTNLGLNKADVPIGMKSLLYTSLVRSKFMYGLETISLSKSRVKQDLSKLENYTLKKACGVNKNSKSTCLIYAMGITPIELYIVKRKLYFILQLLSNKATNELVTKGIHRSLDDIFVMLGIEDKHISLGRDRYQGLIRSMVLKKLEEIKAGETGIKNSDLVNSIRYLLSNRCSGNDDTLQYLLDPRRVSGD